ncbi:MAG: hypothetical protein RSF39_09170 [Romboutsia sp.]
MSNIFDMIEKAKILQEESKIDDKKIRECKSYIANNINEFYLEGSITDFVEIINIYNACFKNGESNIIDILKSKNIPYILAYFRYEEEITKDIVENDAYKAYREHDFISGLEYIKLLYQKYNLDLKMYILKGDILRRLDAHNGAIEAYQSAKELKSVDFSANIKILYTYTLKYKKEWIISIALILTLIVGQFILFDTGLIPSKLKDFSINATEGAYAMKDENTIVIPIGGSVNINIDYRVYPFYGYEGLVSYKIGDENIVNIDVNTVLSGIKEGETTLDIIRDGEVVHTYNIFVKKSKVEHINISMNEELTQVGDIGKIEAEVIRDYDFGGQNEVTFKSSNKKVLAVNDDGIVEVVGSGKASIIVACEDYTKEEMFIIGFVVEDIIVDYDVELEVGNFHQLEVDVVVNSNDKKKPQVMFTIEDDETNIEPIISMDSKGKIKGLKEGTQIVKVVCGGIEKSVIVTVTSKDISKYKVENIKCTSQLQDNYLDINVTWDPIYGADISGYEIYTKFKEENIFTKNGSVDKSSSNYLFRVDLKDFSGESSIDIYIVAKSPNGESKISNIESVKFSYEKNNNNED